MSRRILFVVLIAAGLSANALGQIPDGFVFVRGAEYDGGRVRVEDFEILDHTVTNAEYKAFVDATAHEPPLHWEDGQIPEGKEDYPVVFVNRKDVHAYLEWLTKQDGRVYRLPTGAEFKHAAYSGLDGPRYPWGDEQPATQACPSGKRA